MSQDFQSSYIAMVDKNLRFYTILSVVLLVLLIGSWLFFIFEGLSLYAQKLDSDRWSENSSKLNLDLNARLDGEKEITRDLTHKLEALSKKLGKVGEIQ